MSRAIFIIVAVLVVAKRSAGALAMLGWVMLLLLGYAAYFLPLAPEA
jgi:hypothetical protein